MRASPSLSILGFAIAVALLASACAAAAASPGPTSGPASVPSAALVAQPTATIAPTPLAASSAPTTPSSASSSPTPAPISASDVTALPAGRHAAQVLGSGSYPGYMVDVPAGWFDRQGYFTVKYQGPGPVLGISVWDVGQVFRDSCHWQGQGFDPGPSVDNLVAALVAQSARHASKPKDVTLAGYPGKYLEWSVPSNMVVTGDADFQGCDVEPTEGHRNFMSWLGNGKGERYQQVAGQVDRLWVLDVNGQRLVVDATYSPDTGPADRNQEQQIVESLRFVRP